MGYRYERTLDVAGSYDVVVSGGGPAGFSAAIQAARLGKKTALLEAEGMLGGVMTVGGNPDVALFYAHGRQIIAGIGWELVTRLARDGWARIPDFTADLPHSALGVAVNAPMAAHELDEMCREAGVEVRFHQPVVDVIARSGPGPRAVEAVVVSTRAGLRAIQARVFVDCTGNGDLSFYAGAEYELGGSSPEDLQPGTLRFYPSGYRLEDIDKAQVAEAWARARAAGELEHGDYWPEPNGNPYSLFTGAGNNFNHVHPVNGADSGSVSRAEAAGRRSVARVARWARAHVKGAERFDLTAIAPHVALRESRRILGLAYVTSDDYREAKRYPDAVCHAFYPIDLHKGDRGEQSLDIRHLDRGRVPTIPYGALVPRGFANLLVAGRCVSSDRLANSAIRVKAPCTAMGQAAGTAAVLSLESPGGAPGVEIEALRRTLASSGAIVP